MKQRPRIETGRLVLRPFTLDDAPEVQRLAGDREIASTTLNIPYPYEDEMAQRWIETHQARYEKGELVNFAIVLRSGNRLLGTIGLDLNQPHDNAELGYWIGKPYWGLGYATEAAGAVLRYAFEVRGLNRVYASHFKRNPASGRVLRKIGMIYEGCLRQQVKKWGAFEDFEQYGLLRGEYELGKPGLSQAPPS